MFDFNSLKKQVMVVTFTKKNGETTKMVCTQCGKYINYTPAPVTPGVEVKKRTHNENQVRVWDITKQAWRSFLKDSVLEMVNAPHHTNAYYIKQYNLTKAA